VCNFDKVYTHSGRKRDEAFTEFMRNHVFADIIALDSAEDVVKKSDVIVTGTYSTEPIVKGKWLGDGTHISGMGADGPKKAEMDIEVFKRAKRIIIDSEKCLSIGELATALSSGAISEENIQGKIGQLVAGEITGRDSESDITVFESDGTHIQSGAVVNLIYEKALKLGLGREIEGVSDFFINP
jgi:ornithine cyclodeaminase/alanine dehydrogenase-like protein (mu-crystallin family)